LVGGGEWGRGGLGLFWFCVTGGRGERKSKKVITRPKGNREGSRARNKRPKEVETREALKKGNRTKKKEEDGALYDLVRISGEQDKLVYV